MTREELSNLQNLNLEEKEALTKLRIRQFVDYYGENNVYISFSGGKDSTVLLHLVRSIYPNIPAVFIDTGLEFPEIKEFVRNTENVEIIRPKKTFLQVIDEYGYPVVSKEIACTIDYARKGSKWAIDRVNGKHNYGNHDQYKFLVDAPFKVSSKCCDIMKKEPAKRYEKETGKHPIIGTMAYEGGQRLSAYLRTGCNVFDGQGERPMSKPLSFWNEEDIWDYIHKYNIKYCNIYDKGYRRTGCMFCMFGYQHDKKPTRFDLMKETHPQIYDYCMNKLNLKQIIKYIEDNFVTRRKKSNNDKE